MKNIAKSIKCRKGQIWQALHDSSLIIELVQKRGDGWTSIKTAGSHKVHTITESSLKRYYKLLTES